VLGHLVLCSLSVGAATTKTVSPGLRKWREENDNAALSRK